MKKTALVQYIIDVLPEENSKVLLYEAYTICELKKKLEIYDRLRERAEEDANKKRQSQKRF